METGEKSRVVLHIDDDEDDRQLVSESLCEHDSNISVHGVDNGKDAMLFLQEAKACGSLPGLIILDLNMPVMNGKEFLEALRADPDLSCIPVVIFTTSSAPVDQAFAEEYGVEFITKPPSLRQLSQAIARLVYLLSIGYVFIRVNFLCHIGRY